MTNYLDPALATELAPGHACGKRDAIFAAAWAIADAAGLRRPLVRVFVGVTVGLRTYSLNSRTGVMHLSSIDMAEAEHENWENAIRIATHGSLRVADLMEN